jgi:hypothetical protein
VLLTTVLAASVEAIEMVTIVVGVSRAGARLLWAPPRVLRGYRHLQQLRRLPLLRNRLVRSDKVLDVKGESIELISATQ